MSIHNSKKKNSKKMRRSVYISKKTRRKKIILQVVISKDAYDKLTKIAQELYPELVRGKLSYTIEE